MKNIFQRVVLFWGWSLAGGILLASVPLIGFSQTVTVKETQEPLSLSPSVGSGWEYTGADHTFFVDPGVGLSANFKTATGRKIGLGFNTDVKIREFVGETGTTTAENIRDYTWWMDLSGSTDITSKISAAVTAEAELGRVNAYENIGGEYNWSDLTFSGTYRPIEKSKVVFKYVLDITDSINDLNAITSDGGALDGPPSDTREWSVVPTPAFDSFTLGRTVLGAVNAEYVSVVDYKNYVGASYEQGFSHPLAPTVSGEYNMVINRDSNIDDRDLGLSHIFKAGLSQPLWPNATASLNWKYTISNYQNVFTEDQQFFKQDLQNRFDLKVSQTINDYLSVTAKWRNDYNFGNTTDGSYTNRGWVYLTATF